MTRRAIIALVLLVALAGGGAFGLQKWAARVEAPQAQGIGGAFSLIDTDGRPITDRDLLGRPTVMYFGFTYCPEVCPTTLGALTQWLGVLGPDADRLNVVFVSLDPERDTPKALKAYLSSFDPQIRGLTGSVETIAATAKAYRVYYKKVPTKDGLYTIDHSTAIYLFDSKGNFVAPISYGETEETAVPKLKALLQSGSILWW